MLVIILEVFFFGLTMAVTNVINTTPLQMIVPVQMDMVSVSVDGNSIMKNSSTGWSDGEAAPLESFAGNGSYSFTVTQAGTYRGIA